MTDDNLAHGLFEELNNMFRVRKTRNECFEQREYEKAIRLVNQIIRAIAQSGDFDLCLKAIDMAQDFDLEFLASTQSDRDKVMASRENLVQGRNHHDLLTQHPDSYREHAKGYIKRDRVGRLPNDGMQKALKSHLGHLQARGSLMLAPEEREFLDAQIFLTEAMIKHYSGVQEQALLF